MYISRLISLVRNKRLPTAVSTDPGERKRVRPFETPQSLAPPDGYLHLSVLRRGLDGHRCRLSVVTVHGIENASHLP
jgi:hypothetical protein